MDNNKKRFTPYNLIPNETIKKIANILKRIDKNKLKEVVIQAFIEYFGDDTSKELLSCSIKTIPLLKIPNAVVLVTFDGNPFTEDSITSIAGLARILIKSQIADFAPIPVIYLTPSQAEDTLEHEKIHICQYLQNRAYPMTPDQKELFLTKNLDEGVSYLLKNIGREAAEDFFINATCYITWIEMEANYYTRSYSNSYEWMKKVYRSSQPIARLELIGVVLEGRKADRDKVLERFARFCNTIEKEVDWAGDLVSSTSSLYDLIRDVHIEHSEFEMNRDFGPISEYDKNEYDEDNDKINKLSDEEFLDLAKKRLKRGEEILNKIKLDT
jgi:hypothetical protein